MQRELSPFDLRARSSGTVPHRRRLSGRPLRRRGSHPENEGALALALKRVAALENDLVLTSNLLEAEKEICALSQEEAEILTRTVSVLQIRLGRVCRFAQKYPCISKAINDHAFRCFMEQHDL